MLFHCVAVVLLLVYACDLHPIFYGCFTDVDSHRACHEDVIKWKHFPRYWPFVRGIHRWLAQSVVTRSIGVFLICAWIYVWVNNAEAGDLRRHRTHYDVIVMWLFAHALNNLRDRVRSKTASLFVPGSFIIQRCLVLFYHTRRHIDVTLVSNNSTRGIATYEWKLFCGQLKYGNTASTFWSAYVLFVVLVWFQIFIWHGSARYSHC